MTKEWANAKPRRRRRGVREDAGESESNQATLEADFDSAESPSEE
jgi:hypothetical protein